MPALTHAEAPGAARCCPAAADTGSFDLGLPNTEMGKVCPGARICSCVSSAACLLAAGLAGRRGGFPRCAERCLRRARSRTARVCQRCCRRRCRCSPWQAQVVTRFPPEPSGYLHIGHAKVGRCAQEKALGGGSQALGGRQGRLLSGSALARGTAGAGPRAGPAPAPGRRMAARLAQPAVRGTAAPTAPRRATPPCAHPATLDCLQAALLNQHFASMYKGKLLVRFDDTNPSKASGERRRGRVRAGAGGCWAQRRPLC